MKGNRGAIAKGSSSRIDRDEVSLSSAQSEDSLLSLSTFNTHDSLRGGGKYASNRYPGVDISTVSESYRGSRRSGGSGLDDASTMSRENLEMTSNLGTTAWCAPEVLTASSKARYSVKVDVYSFGMVLWELWERKRPFDDLLSRFDIMDAVRSGKRPAISASCPAAYRSLIQRCWQGDPSRRPMFQYIVRYLKDELARVKRKRGRESIGTSRVSANNEISTGESNASGAIAGGSALDALDAVRGQINRLIPWSRADNDSLANEDLRA